ncbi:MAG: chitobiase/beta-hexosaminidase C-terminal domain-containing protein [Verrucomicrobiales bacterium]|nr:chitobiase/beta-hexosaminidase C-terminal domain-containing protein [Verrucomicrobiales bacterium]
MKTLLRCLLAIIAIILIPSNPGATFAQEAPSIGQSPSSQAVAIGGTITLSVRAQGSLPLTYQWIKDGTPIPQANQSSYEIRNATSQDGGFYTVRVGNSAGSVLSMPAVVTVVAGREPVRVYNPNRIAGQISMSVLTRRGFLYILEQTADLLSSVWEPVVAITGDGLLRDLADRSPAVQSRFYRVAEIELGDRNKSIYGLDDRLDLYEDPSALHRSLASAVCGILPADALSPSGDGIFQLSTRSFTDYMLQEFGYPLCSEERFRTQQTAPGCTGWLISSNLLVTAGHCVGHGDPSVLPSLRFLFGFVATDATHVPTQYATNQIYRGIELERWPSDYPREDYAVIRLDRPVELPDVRPLTVRTNGRIAAGTAVGVIGHPAGLPMKTAFGNDTFVTSYVDAENRFYATLDTYGGNSGSPVFDAATGVVEGILVTGRDDFRLRAGCIISARYSDLQAADVEGVYDITRVPNVAALVPAAFPASVVVSATNLTVAEGSTATFLVHLSSHPVGNVVVSVAQASGDTDLAVATGSSLLFTPVNWNLDQTVTLAAARDTDAANGSAVFRVEAAGLSAVELTATELDVDTTPMILSQPQATIVLEGQTASFSAAANGTPTPTLRWQRSTDGGNSWGDLSDGGGVSGSSGGTLSIANTTLAMNGQQFRLQARNSAGTAASIQALLTVEGQAITLTGAVSGIYDFSGRTVTIGDVAVDSFDGRDTPGDHALETSGTVGDGQSSGTFRVIADRIVVTGVISAAGRGYGGGGGGGGAAYDLYPFGPTVGAGGSTGATEAQHGGSGSAIRAALRATGGSGGQGQGFGGSSGTEGGKGGWPSFSGIDGGAGGSGAGPWHGGPSIRGGYAAAEANGDSTTGFELFRGSGGGGGNGGNVRTQGTSDTAGSGQNGGAGGGEGQSTAYCAGGGGGGGGGAGGGVIILEASTSIEVRSEAALVADGGGRASLSGGYGAGGGVGLKSPNIVIEPGATVRSLGGFADNVGSGENGGTLKILFSRTGGLSGSADPKLVGRLFLAEYDSTNIFTAPAFRSQPQSALAELHGAASFQIDVQGYPIPALRWQQSGDSDMNWRDLQDGGAISGSRAGTLTITDCSLDQDNLRFRVVAENILGVRTSEPATLRVIPSAVATPTFAPVVTSHVDSVTVTILCDTADAIIRYTRDGSEPDGGATAYTAPFVLGDSATLKARAFKAGLSDSAVATTRYQINHTPSAIPQEIGATLGVPKNVILAGSDRDGDTLSFVIVTPPQQGTLAGTAPNLTYTANAGASGQDGFQFRVNDGKLDSPMATVTITVVAANRPPEANAQEVVVTVGTPKAISLSGSDPDNDGLSYSVTAQPTKGTLTGTAPNLTYTANAGASGQDSFQFKVSDGKADSPVATVTIGIRPQPDVPPRISYWPLDETSGLRRDPRGGNDLTPVNGVGNGAGKAGGAAHFTRTQTQYLAIPSASQNGLVFSGGSYTILAWVKPDSVTGRQTIVSRWGGGGVNPDGYMLRVDPNTMELDHQNDGDYDSHVIVPDVWQFVGATWNATNQIAQLWYQGAKSRAFGLPVSPGAVEHEFRIGAKDDAGNEHCFDGFIDEVVVANSVIPDDEILAIYGNVLGGRGAFEVAAPTISPNGGSFADSVTVTLACATAGATIRYTTDGNDPISGSTEYSGPFTLTSTATVKAKAFRAGFTTSGIASATFTLGSPLDLSFGGVGGDVLHAVKWLPDGGMILTGNSASPANTIKSEPGYGGLDYWVVRLDATGQKVWDRTLGGTADDDLWALVPSRDGGFVLAGHSFSGADGNKTTPGAGGSDAWIVKLSANGDVAWQRSLGGSGDQYLYGIDATTEGGYILAGTSAQPNAKFWMIKISHDGTREWERTFGGNGDDVATSVQQTSDGGFVLAGIGGSQGGTGDRTSPSHGQADYWLIKTDAEGNKVWDRSYGGTELDWAYSVRQTREGGYVLAGLSLSGVGGNKATSSEGGQDAWIIKVDANGTKMWERTLGGAGEDATHVIRQTSNGEFVVGGYSTSSSSGNRQSPGYGDRDFWIQRLSESGELLWEDAMGGAGRDQVHSIDVDQNGKVLVGGSSASPAGPRKTAPHFGESDYWILTIP